MNGFWQTLRRKRAVLLSLCGVLALCVLAASTARRGGAVPASAEVTNWGLSFQQEGEPPVGNASSQYLAQYNALYRADTQEKILYLTFDAGFENGNTTAILDALKQHNVPATFFLVGNYLETQPELEEGKERAWLLQVTANQCRDLWRRLRRRATVPLEEAACATAPAQEPLGLWELVQALPEEQRLAVTLYYYDGLSVREIAQVLGAPQGTVKSRLSRGRDKLRERLREEGIYEL